MVSYKLRVILYQLELSRAQNHRRVAWHLLHVQAGNDNYIDRSAHMHASQAQVEGCRTTLEVEYEGLISSLV